MRKRIFLACCCFSFFALNDAHGTLFTLTDIEVFQLLRASLDEVSKSLNLDRGSVDYAEFVATGWVYLGPCNGDQSQLASKPGPKNGEDPILAVATKILNLAPTQNTDAAIMEMFAIIAREGFLSSSLLGRPSPLACTFALQTAQAKWRDLGH